MLKKILLLALVVTLITTTLVFADDNQSALSKVTGLSDQKIAELSRTYGGFGRILTASIVAKLTDEKIEDVLKAHLNGTAFYEIAQSKGIKLDAYKEALEKAKTVYIDEQVKAGVLTKEQAQIMKDRITLQFENCDGLGSSNGYGFGNCGGMRGFGQKSGMYGGRMRGFFN